MTQASTADIKESSNKRRFFHQAHAVFNKLNQDYSLPGDVLIATSPEGMNFGIGEVPTNPLPDHISENMSKFVIRAKEISPPYLGDAGSYRNATVIHVPGHVDPISETNRQDIFFSYLKSGQEAIDDSIQLFFNLNHQDPYEPPSLIELLRPSPTFLTQKPWKFRPIAGSDREQSTEIVPHIRGDDNPDSFGSTGDAVAFMMPPKDAPLLQDRWNVEVAIVVDSIGHPKCCATWHQFLTQ